MLKNTFILIITLLFIFSCSATKVTKNTGDGEEEKYVEKETSTILKLDVNKLYAWLNLMPGSEPRFNISGDLDISFSKDYNLDNLKLKYVKVYQNNREIFYIQPTTRENKTKDSIKNILFSTLKGMILTPGFNPDKKVDVNLIFDDDGEELINSIKGIKVEKVY